MDKLLKVCKYVSRNHLTYFIVTFTRNSNDFMSKSTFINNFDLIANQIFMLLMIFFPPNL